MKNILNYLCAGAMACFFAACTSSPKGGHATVTPDEYPDRALFTDTIDGGVTGLFELKNEKGMIARITNYGGRIVGLSLPDHAGKPVDVVVGMKSVDDYRNATEPYFGALIGRVGNRIAKGRFVLDGQEYQLNLNNGPNTLHGGVKGFQYVVWDAVQPNDSTLELSYLAKDGEEHFPGNLEVKVVYCLLSSNALDIRYRWKSDVRTVCNLTNHAFFNLNGEGSGPVMGHKLRIKAASFTPVDSTLIPTGEIRPVEHTPFDFNTAVSIGSRISEVDEQLQFGGGYDHNYVLQKSGDDLEWVAQAEGDKSGIVMDIYTTAPGLQFYSGNFMQSANGLKSGARDDYRTAFCLETQGFPDAVNHANFPSIVVEPHRWYSSQTVYKFNSKP